MQLFGPTKSGRIIQFWFHSLLIKVLRPYLKYLNCKWTILLNLINLHDCLATHLNNFFCKVGESSFVSSRAYGWGTVKNGSDLLLRNLHRTVKPCWYKLNSIRKLSRWLNILIKQRFQIKTKTKMNNQKLDFIDP